MHQNVATETETEEGLCVIYHNNNNNNNSNSKSMAAYLGAVRLAAGRSDGVLRRLFPARQQTAARTIFSCPRLDLELALGGALQKKECTSHKTAC